MRKKYWKIAGLVIGGWLLITLVWFGLDLDGKFDWSIGRKYVDIEEIDTTKPVESFAETMKPKEPEYLYGISVDSFDVTTDRIKQNQFLHNILHPHGVDLQTIDAIGRQWKDTFDVRRMRANHKFTILKHKGDTPKPAYFIYEIDNTDYVVYNLDDTLFAYRGKKPMQVKMKETGGIINSSLYQTLDDRDASPALAMKMAEVFAWAVDFYRIQKGDYFKVIYEERWVDGKRVGIGHVHAALFNHYDQDYYAFWFEKDGQGGNYYDENNKSCRKAFLKAPLKFFRLTSPYTMNRRHPVTGVPKPHLGTDYAAASGTPIMSTANGTVIEARFSRFNGNYVKVRHNSVFTTQYLHMRKIANGIRPGVRIKQGQTIGYVGSTGLATGPHVCYRFWQNGKQVDPRRVKIPPAEPIKAEYESAYDKHKNEWMKKLNAISTKNQQDQQPLAHTSGK